MAQATTTSSNLAVKRSWIRVLLFGLLSFGLYYMYWFYVTRTQVDAELGDARTIKQSPGWQLGGPILLMAVSLPLMLIVIGFLGYLAAIVLGIYIFYALIKDMATAAQKAGAPEISVPLVIVLQIFTGLGAVVAQDGWNKYWDKKTNGKATDAPVTGAEIAVAVAGIVVFVLFLALGVFAAIVGNSASDELEDLQRDANKALEESQNDGFSY